MTFKTLIAASALALSLPLAAQAQGTIPGAERGAAAGADAAGPIGGIVGGAVGAATGTVGGILGVDMAPRFRSYVRERNVRSYDYDGRVAVGTDPAGLGRDLLRRAVGVPGAAGLPLHRGERPPGAGRPRPPHRRGHRLIPGRPRAGHDAPEPALRGPSVSPAPAGATLHPTGR